MTIEHTPQWTLGDLDDISPDPEVSEWRQQILCDGSEVAATSAVDADGAVALGRKIIVGLKLLGIAEEILRDYQRQPDYQGDIPDRLRALIAEARGQKEA